MGHVPEIKMDLLDKEAQTPLQDMVLAAAGAIMEEVRDALKAQAVEVAIRLLRPLV
jgi:hypothetical protein